MAICDGLITGGIDFNCDNYNAPIGVDKDLILVNYDEFDRIATLDAANREADDTNGNEGGLTNIELKLGAVQNVFEGRDYSIVPTVTSEIRENSGDSWFMHSIAFIAYNKAAKARKTLEKLAQSKVVAIVVDKSTGLYEIFGIDQGLKISAVERTYVGGQNGNFYSVTIATPDISVVRESTTGELATAINTAV